MYTIIITVVVFAVVFGIGAYLEHYDIAGALGGAFTGVFVGFFVGCLLALMVPTPSVQFQKTYNLEVLQDNVGGSGDFVLGIGKVGDELSYIYYYESNGYYIADRISCSSAKIKYIIPKAKPVLRVTWEKALDTKWGISSGVEKNMQHIFEVPAGTIRQNYFLDAK